ncbi:MAG: hypothetical protein RMM58_13955 [Chloroflexota bacterium]|nr:hypothetical protein [Dehalococcoidia bacterium]MDW8254976.1 hypothetical protein [Chloroflexota bacterium]
MRRRWIAAPRRALRAALSLAALGALLVSALPGASEAAAGDDWAVQGGWFFTQTRGTAPAGTGFAVLDSGGIPFYNAFRQLGGVDALGYPVTHRFVLDDAVVQAFQRGVLEWRPGAGVQLASVMRILADAGLDDWLTSTYAVPAGGEPNAELLAANGSIAAAYHAIPNAAAIFGQPVALEDFGPVVTLRTERLALQQWRTATSFAPAGAVIVPNAGDMLGAAGLIPVGAAQPTTAEQLRWGAGGAFPYAAVTLPQPYYYLPYYPYYAPPSVRTQPYYPVNYHWGHWYPYGVYHRPMVYPYYIYGIWAPYTYPYVPYTPAVPYYQPYWSPWVPWWWQPWAPPKPAACQGDEEMSFDPGRPRVNQLFTIAVTSSRPSVNVSVQGPGSPRFLGVSGGGKGYVWRWQAQIGVPGTFNFNFLVGGTVCTANVVTIG